MPVSPARVRLDGCFLYLQIITHCGTALPLSLRNGSAFPSRDYPNVRDAQRREVIGRSVNGLTDSANNSRFCIQPTGGNKELVMSLSPITHKVHVGNTIPRNGSGMFGHDHLKLSPYLIQKV